MATLKIPDDYAQGSKPLTPLREDVAIGLVSLSMKLALHDLADKEFRKNLGIPPDNDKEFNRASIELCIFNLFIASRWMMGNIKDNPAEILDRMFYHYRKAMSENDMQFGAIVDERYVVYSQAMANKAGLGPTFHVGKAAAQYAMGREELDPGILMPLIWGLNKLMIDSADTFKQFVSSKLK